MADFTLPTPRLVLREWREADIAALHAICTDARVMEFLGPPQSLAEVEGAVSRMRAAQAMHGHCFWAVERREDGAMLGFCGIKRGPEGTPLHDRPEIGWRLRADAWGQGYAREAAQASLDWAAAHRPGTRVWAMTVPANKASWGLMLRLGMARHPALDFDHPALPEDSPLRAHIVYSIVPAAAP